MTAWLSNPHNLAASLIAGYLLTCFAAMVFFRLVMPRDLRDEVAGELAAQGAAAPFILGFAVLIAPVLLACFAVKLRGHIKRDRRRD